MEPINTYTYRQSELPPITHEMAAEISRIHFEITHFIRLNPGHYHALSELTEMLASCLNLCETYLLSIRITPDGGEPQLLPREIDLTNLPTLEKQLIVSIGATSNIAIKMLATFLGCTFDRAASHVAVQVNEQVEKLSPQEVEEMVESMAKSLREQPDQSFPRIQF